MLERGVLIACCGLAGASASTLLTGITPLRVLVAALAGVAIGLVAALPSARPAGSRGEQWVPLLALAYFVPLVTHTVAPGADMAMHAAMARAIVDGQPWLSPAWPGLAPGAYPRGLSCVMALLAVPLGLAKASLVAAGLAYAAYLFGLRALFRDALGLPHAGLVAALILFASITPQIFFDWGGDPTVLAIALGLVAAGVAGAHAVDHPLRAGVVMALLLVGSILAHPSGALAGLACVGLVLAFRLPRSPGRVLVAGALAFLPVVLVVLFLQRHGPALSPAELEWIDGFNRYDGNVLYFSNRLLFPLTVWVAAAGVVGPPVLLAYFVAAAAEARSPEGRRRLGWSLAGMEALGLLFAVGPSLPLVGTLLYPGRLSPLLALPLVPTLAHGGLRWWERAVAAGRERRWTAIAASVAGTVHLATFQLTRTMVTRADLEVIGCLAQRTAPDAVVEGAYGDATQWIPALAARRITRPHTHCSLFDEVEAQKKALVPTHRMVGEVIRWEGPLDHPPPAHAPLCQSGRAALYALP